MLDFYLRILGFQFRNTIITTNYVYLNQVDNRNSLFTDRDNVFEETHLIISEYYPVANLDDYPEADKNLRTACSTTEDSIISNIRGDDLSDDSDADIILDDVDEVILPTRKSAAAALKSFRVFLESEDDSSKPLMCLSEIEDYITDATFQKTTKQTLITSYNASI